MSTPQSLDAPLEWDLTDRLHKSLRVAEMKPPEMADHLGVHRNTIGPWLRGTKVPSRRTLIAWALRCGVPFDWLAYGITASETGPEGGGDQRVASPRWGEQSARSGRVVRRRRGSPFHDLQRTA